MSSCRPSPPIRKHPTNCASTVLDILVARRSNLTSDQYAFLTSRLSPQSDAVMRQTAARIIGRSTPDRQQLLQIAREHLPKADPLTLSTILDCFRTSKDEEVGKALIAVLQKSPSALGTLGEERLKTLLAGYPDRTCKSRPSRSSRSFRKRSRSASSGSRNSNRC